MPSTIWRGTEEWGIAGQRDPCYRCEWTVGRNKRPMMLKMPLIMIVSLVLFFCFSKALLSISHSIRLYIFVQWKQGNSFPTTHINRCVLRQCVFGWEKLFLVICLMRCLKVTFESKTTPWVLILSNVLNVSAFIWTFVSFFPPYWFRTDNPCFCFYLSWLSCTKFSVIHDFMSRIQWKRHQLLVSSVAKLSNVNKCSIRVQ